MVSQMRVLTVRVTKVGKFFSVDYVILLLLTFWFSPVGIFMLPSLNLINLNQARNIYKMNMRLVFINWKLPFVMTWQVWFLTFSGFTIGAVINPVDIPLKSKFIHPKFIALFWKSLLLQKTKIRSTFSGVRHSSVITSAACVILSTIAWIFSAPIVST